MNNLIKEVKETCGGSGKLNEERAAELTVAFPFGRLSPNTIRKDRAIGTSLE